MKTRVDLNDLPLSRRRSGGYPVVNMPNFFRMARQTGKDEMHSTVFKKSRAVGCSENIGYYPAEHLRGLRPDAVYFDEEWERPNLVQQMFKLTRAGELLDATEHK